MSLFGFHLLDYKQNPNKLLAPLACLKSDHPDCQTSPYPPFGHLLIVWVMELFIVLYFLFGFNLFNVISEKNKEYHKDVRLWLLVVALSALVILAVGDLM